MRLLSRVSELYFLDFFNCTLFTAIKGKLWCITDVCPFLEPCKIKYTIFGLVNEYKDTEKNLFVFYSWKDPPLKEEWHHCVLYMFQNKMTYFALCQRLLMMTRV